MKHRPFRKPQNESAPGEESFLDVVANLVGVLIILVVVVGVNAGSHIHEATVSGVDEEEVTGLARELESTRSSAAALLHDNRELETRIGLEGALAERRAAERQQLLVAIEAARRQLEQHKASMSAERQQELELAARQSELQRKLAELDLQMQSLAEQDRQRQVIEHYPTPIAKTVFTDEVHFRLREGRLVYVPMNELVELMRNEWQQKARKLETARETTETVGPVGDFRLQYLLQLEDEPVSSPGGVMTRRTPRFTRFVLVPVRESIGDPIETALADNSAFRRQVDGMNADKTTISVWVYPDSFAEFNTLKGWLYQRGFRTACWPLSSNSPISGGPTGYRSTAQ